MCTKREVEAREVDGHRPEGVEGVREREVGVQLGFKVTYNQGDCWCTYNEGG